MKFGCTSQSCDRILSSGRFSLEKWIEFSRGELGLDDVEIDDKHLANPEQEYLDGLRKLVADNWAKDGEQING